MAFTDEFDDPRDWQERLRDELLPYAAFYGLGLSWISVISAMSVWAPAPARALTIATVVFGTPVTAMVTLMLVWRAAMAGLAIGRVVPMVVGISSATMLVIAAFGLVFPALAIGHAAATMQMRALGFDRSPFDTRFDDRDCDPRCR